ncbi:OmpA family protein [Neptunicella sp. SCSIO 80796]|uniref:OmpA family protein n=1 Tax=Neptunicella plasticusilytica TaxID=3117012 RepID=UPI003A4D8484
MRKLVVAVIFTTLSVGGCATNASNTQKGAGIGAVVGAVLGKATGDNAKSRYVWGAAVGALAGSAIGSYMDKQEQEFREELSDTGVSVERDGDNLRLIMPGNITFATGSANIVSNFGPILNDVVTVLNRFEKTVLHVTGHTDNVGNDAYNQQLSLNRANSVKNYLIQHSVDARRVTTQGFGESMPIADNGTESGRQQNRRVELTISPLKK